MPSSRERRVTRGLLASGSVSLIEPSAPRLIRTRQSAPTQNNMYAEQSANEPTTCYDIPLKDNHPKLTAPNLRESTTANNNNPIAREAQNEPHITTASAATLERNPTYYFDNNNNNDRSIKDKLEHGDQHQNKDRVKDKDNDKHKVKDEDNDKYSDEERHKEGNRDRDRLRGQDERLESNETDTKRPKVTPEEPVQIYHVEKVLNKKIFRNKTWYKLKWVGYEEPTWELAENCSCDILIAEYEKMVQEQSKDEEDDEWEVSEIIDKRTKSDGKVEYLVKWKNWNGNPTWVDERHCKCVNLIAAYENPKLRKMWNFDGSNPRLWLDQEAMLSYMKKFANFNDHDVNILRFEPDFPPDETQQILEDGINIGPLSYKNHWYLVIILINYICITKEILICDPLNTLIGTPNTAVHPVFKRMTKVYKGFSVTPVAMTPMKRSDTCAFYVLAAYERALFCLHPNARFIVNKLFFDHSIPELIRVQLLPNSDSEISVNLIVPPGYLDGPKCEFCGWLRESSEEINVHILEAHIRRDKEEAD